MRMTYDDRASLMKDVRFQFDRGQTLDQIAKVTDLDVGAVVRLIR